LTGTGFYITVECGLFQPGLVNKASNSSKEKNDWLQEQET
jgi:hypothetical protein